MFDIAEAFRATSVDVVVVASPTHLHAEAVQMALEFGRPKLILCEKPLSYTLHEAQEIVDGCRRYGCLLYVNYPRRVDPGVLEVKRRLETGAIVSPMKGVVWYTKGLLHNGSHFANLFEFWLGPVQDFTVINVGRKLSPFDVEPDVHVRYSGGEVTFIAVKDEHFSLHEIQLAGANGCLRYLQGGMKILWQSVVPDQAFPEYNVLSSQVEEISTEGATLQRNVAEHVSACLLGKPSTLCSGDDALQTLKSLLEMKAAL